MFLFFLILSYVSFSCGLPCNEPSSSSKRYRSSQQVPRETSIHKVTLLGIVAMSPKASQDAVPCGIVASSLPKRGGWTSARLMNFVEGLWNSSLTSTVWRIGMFQKTGRCVCEACVALSYEQTLKRCRIRRIARDPDRILTTIITIASSIEVKRIPKIPQNSNSFQSQFTNATVIHHHPASWTCIHQGPVDPLHPPTSNRLQGLDCTAPSAPWLSVQRTGPTRRPVAGLPGRWQMGGCNMVDPCATLCNP